MGLKHASFIGRTIIVKKGNVDEAYRILHKFCSFEGIFNQYKKMLRYEKPFMVRRRVNLEKCTALYNEDLERKIKFISRKNRRDPFPAS